MPGRARGAGGAPQAAGFLLIVVTNQPDVARGAQSREKVEQINALLKKELPLDEVRVCYHDDGDGCGVPKAAPGHAPRGGAGNWGSSLEQSYMIGDRWRDIEAGERAGTRTIFIDHHYRETRPARTDAEVSSLVEAAQWILSQEKGEQMKLNRTESEDLRRRRGQGRHAGDVPPAVDQRLHDEPDPDAQGGHHRLPRLCPRHRAAPFPTARSPSRCSPTISPRWSARRTRSPPGATRLREDPHHQHDGARRRADLIRRLSHAGIKLNVTAMMTLEQVKQVAANVSPGVPCYVSVFAGRIADTGRDPLPLMIESVKILRPLPKAELIWASPRELLNIIQADQIGCQIITVTNDILKKVKQIGYDLGQFSLDTVKMFYEDAQKAGFTL